MTARATLVQDSGVANGDAARLHAEDAKSGKSHDG